MSSPTPSGGNRSRRNSLPDGGNRSRKNSWNFVRKSKSNQVRNHDANSSNSAPYASSFRPLQPPDVLLEVREASADAETTRNPKSSGKRRCSITGQFRVSGGSLVHPLSRMTGQCTRLQDCALENLEQGAVTGFRKFLSFGVALHQPQHDGSSSGFGGPLGDYSVEDNDDDEVQERSRNLRLYINSVWVIGLTVADMVLFFMFELLTKPDDDFICSRAEDGSILYEVQNISLMGVIIILHLCYIVQHSINSDSGAKAFKFSFSKILHWITLVAATAALILHTHFCGTDILGEFGYLILLRIHMVVHGLRVALLVKSCQKLREHLRRRLQRAVSLHRRRYIDPGMQLDLDMTYIADRVLAMSIPCVDSAPYRNDMADVARFFASRHYGSFAVLNLCQHHEESGNGNYHPSLLFGQVQKSPMRDHNAPAFQSLVDFCDSATTFLNAGERNVVAVHCQGGKGRTGLFVAALLLWVGLCDTAQEALEYFARRRSMPKTPPHKMIRPTSPAQIRYLRYMEKLVVEGFEFAGSHPLILHKIIINKPPLQQNTWNIALVIEQGSSVLFDHFKATGNTYLHADKNSGSILIDVERLRLNGDVTLRIYSMDSDTSGVPYGTPPKIDEAGRVVKYGTVKGTQTAFITVHTAPVAAGLKGNGGVVTFRKEDIDDVHKDTSHKVFDENFSICLDLSKVQEGLAGDEAGPLEKGGDSIHTCTGTASAASTTVSRSNPVVEPPSKLLPLPNTASLFLGQRTQRAPSRFGIPPLGLEVQEGEALSNDSFMLAFASAGYDAQTLLDGERVSGPGAMGLPSLHDVVSKLCRPEDVHMYNQGEVILDTTLPEHEDGMSLFYVMSGRVQMEPFKMGPVGGYSGCLGMPDLATCASRGPGECFGVMGMSCIVPGGRELLGGLIFRAKSEEAVVAEIRLSRQLHDESPVHIPAPKHGLDNQGHCVLYEYLARQLCAWSRGLRTQLTLQKMRRKANASTTTALAERKAMYERVMSLHSLPLSEKVLTSCQVSHVGRKHTNGQLLLFKNWLIFRAQTSIGTNNITQDVKIALENVAEISLKKDVLTIHCEDNEPGSNISAVSREDPINVNGSAMGWKGAPGSADNSQHGSVGRTSPSKKRLLGASSDGGVAARKPGRNAKFNSTFLQKTRLMNSGRMKPAELVVDTEISFVIGGGAARSVAGNAAAIYERVVKQHTLVKSRTGRGLEELWNNSKMWTRIEMVLGKEELLMGKRRMSIESEALGCEEHMLRRWGFILAGEHVEPTTVETLSVLVANAPVQRYNAGEFLMSEGSEEKKLFLILSGKVCSRSAPGEKLDVRQAGDMMGARGFFSGGNAGATTTLIAETDSEVLIVERQALDATCRVCPAAGARFFRALAMNLGSLVCWQFELLGEEEEEEATENRRRSVTSAGDSQQ